jgi:multimeric flavodoxin WrbA
VTPKAGITVLPPIKTTMMPLNLIGTSLWTDYRRFDDSLWRLATSFSEEAVAHNHEIFRHDLPHYQIKPCQHCESCYSKEVACSYLDDFNLLPPDLLLSENLIIFTEAPFSQTLGNALSKCVCYPHAPKGRRLKKVALVYLGEADTSLETLFQQAASYLSDKTMILRNPTIDQIKTLAADF